MSEERVAGALNVDIRAGRRKRDLLKGICSEVVNLLENHRLSEKAFSALRKMKLLRQIESAELMVASNNFSLRFINAILSMTKPDMLISGEPRGTGRMHNGVRNSSLQNEQTNLVRQLKAIENSYGTDMLSLAVSRKYVERIMANAKVKRYLESTCPETLTLLSGLLQHNSQSEHNAA